MSTAQILQAIFVRPDQYQQLIKLSWKNHLFWFLLSVLVAALIRSQASLSQLRPQLISYIDRAAEEMIAQYPDDLTISLTDGVLTSSNPTLTIPTPAWVTWSNLPPTAVQFNTDESLEQNAPPASLTLFAERLTFSLDGRSQTGSYASLFPDARFSIDADSAPEVITQTAEQLQEVARSSAVTIVFSLGYFAPMVFLLLGFNIMLLTALLSLFAVLGGRSNPLYTSTRDVLRVGIWLAVFAAPVSAVLSLLHPSIDPADPSSMDLLFWFAGILVLSSSLFSESKTTEQE